jgi:hypothetical protein
VGHGLPVAVLLAVFLLIWYAAAWGMNGTAAVERVLPNSPQATLDLAGPLSTT